VIGSERPWYPPTDAEPDADIIVLNHEAPHPDHLYWNYPADVLAQGVPSEVIPEIASSVTQSASSNTARWKKRHDSWRKQWHNLGTTGADTEPVDSFWLVKKLDNALPSDTLVINETVSHASIVTNILTDNSDRMFISAEKLSAGGLGSGLGVALGAKLAEPDRVAVALVGDGAFNYNPVQAAFGAAQEYDLPLLVVLFDNSGYQVMNPAYDEHYEGQAAYGTKISPKPDYVSMVTAWNVHGETVDSSQAVRSAVENGLRTVREEGRSVLLDVVLPDQSPSFPTCD